MPPNVEPLDGEAEGSARKKLKTSRTTSKAIMLSSSPNMEPSHTKSSSPPAHTADGLKSKDSSCTPCQHQLALTTLHTDLDAMRHLITCKICDRLLYEPFSLVCGHTYCYSCLSTWLVNNRKKTCPDCRAQIAQQPNPNFVIREMALIFINKTELLPDGETSEQHIEWAREEMEAVAKDRNDLHPKTGGIFKGVFKKGGRRSFLPLRDPGDGVDRCPACHWELEGGQCEHCGLDLEDSDDSFGDYDDDLSIDDDELRQVLEEDGLDPGHLWGDYTDDGPESDDPFRAQRVPGVNESHGDVMLRVTSRGQGPRPLAVGSSSEDGESEDEEHDSEMDGFLQDDDHISMESGASDGEDSDTATATPPRRRRARQRQRRAVALSEDEGEPAQSSVVQIDSDEDDDEPVVTASQRNKRDRDRIRRARQPVSISSDNDEGSSDSDDHTSERSAQQTEDALAGHNAFLTGLAGFSPLHEGVDGHDDDTDVSDDNDGLDDFSGTDYDNDAEQDGMVYPGYGGDVFEGETGYAGFGNAENDYSEDDSDANGWDGDPSAPRNSRSVPTFGNAVSSAGLGCQRNMRTAPVSRSMWEPVPTVTFISHGSVRPRESSTDIASSIRARRRVSASLPDILAEMQNRRRSEAYQYTNASRPGRAGQLDHPFQLGSTLAGIQARNPRFGRQNSHSDTSLDAVDRGNAMNENHDSSDGSSVTVGRARRPRRRAA